MIYRKFDPTTWNLPAFKALEQDAQHLYLYVALGPYGSLLPGVFTVGRAQLAEDRGWDVERLDRAVDQLRDAKLLYADWPSRLIWLPVQYNVNAPNSSKVVLGWRNYWRAIPECSLRQLIAAFFDRVLTLLGETYITAFHRIAGTATYSMEFVSDIIADIISGIAPRARATAPAPVPDFDPARERVQGEGAGQSQPDVGGNAPPETSTAAPASAQAKVDASEPAPVVHESGSKTAGEPSVPSRTGDTVSKLTPSAGPMPPEARAIAESIAMTTGESIDAEMQWRLFVLDCREKGRSSADWRASWEKWTIHAAAFSKRDRMRIRAQGEQPGLRRAQPSPQPFDSSAPWFVEAKKTWQEACGT